MVKRKAQERASFNFVHMHIHLYRDHVSMHKLDGSYQHRLDKLHLMPVQFL